MLDKMTELLITRHTAMAPVVWNKCLGGGLTGLNSYQPEGLSLDTVGIQQHTVAVENYRCVVLQGRYQSHTKPSSRIQASARCTSAGTSTAMD
jgi:hypothetical protein